jgi:hypothetical protein
VRDAGKRFAMLFSKPTESDYTVFDFFHRSCR